MREMSNPVKAHHGQNPTIRLHNGFHDYLFEPSSRGAKGPDGEPLSEYQEILQEHVIPVLKDNPGYKLYVTGHSLGAALATLFAFQAAAEHSLREYNKSFEANKPSTEAMFLNDLYSRKDIVGNLVPQF
jgi:hypothetical protein